jgi:hypothetical protein
LVAQNVARVGRLQRLDVLGQDALGRDAAVHDGVPPRRQLRAGAAFVVAVFACVVCVGWGGCAGGRGCLYVEFCD